MFRFANGTYRQHQSRVPWIFAFGKQFTSTRPPKTGNPCLLTGLAGGTLLASVFASKPQSSSGTCNDKAILQLKAVANKKEAQDAYEKLKKEMKISSGHEKTTDWEQLIFVIKGAIEAKRLKEELALAKKQVEKELQAAVAANDTLNREAERIFKQKEKLVRAQCKLDFEAKVREETERANAKLLQSNKRIEQDLDWQLKNQIERQDSAMVRNLLEKFKDFKSQSESIANTVTKVLSKKQQDFEYQGRFIEENKRLLVLREKCRALESALKIDKIPASDWTEQMYQITILTAGAQEAFQGKDAIAQAVLETLPKNAVRRGVLTEIGLKERFKKVYDVAQNLALLKDEGPHSGSMYVASYIRAMLTVQKSYCNPELTSDFVPKDLDNAELLYRASACMENNDIENAVKFVERLKGASTNVAAGWLNEAHNYLKVVQAISILKNYCTLQINRSCYKCPEVMVNQQEMKDN